MESILRKIERRFDLNGYPNIQLFFSDDCCHEYGSISRAIPELVDNREQAAQTRRTKSGLPKATLSKLNRTAEVLTTYTEVEGFAQRLAMEVYEHRRSKTQMYVGFDAEWLEDDEDCVPQTIQIVHPLLGSRR
jgi:hypothetical protein